MKNIFIIFIFIIGSFLVGCSSDDSGTNNGNGEEEPDVPRLVADTLVAAPSTFDANDGVWATLDSTIVPIGFTTTYGQNPQLVKDTLLMKAILKSDMLYIWAKWVDPTPDIWGNFILKTTGGGSWEHIEMADYNGGEDAFMILFDAGDNGAEGADCATMCHAVTNKMGTTGGGHVDGWCWKSARLAPAYLAEDNWWSSAGNFLDPPVAINRQQPYRENWNDLLNTPSWMHPDDTAFHGPYLYYSDVVEFDPDPFIGWDDVAGYKMPGFAIDTTIYSKAERDDQWDVLSASYYDSLSLSHTWTVVLSRTLAAPTSNDVDLTTVDSIEISVAASNEHTYGTDPSFKNHSGSVPFYLILPRAAVTK